MFGRLVIAFDDVAQPAGQSAEPWTERYCHEHRADRVEEDRNLNVTASQLPTKLMPIPIGTMARAKRLFMCPPRASE